MISIQIFTLALVAFAASGQQSTTPFDRARQEYICANSVLDLIFVLDSSASIWEPDFYRQISFVENIVKQFEIGPLYTQVGIVTFGQTYWLKFHLNRYHDKKSLLQAVKRVKYRPGSYTNTGDAIKFMNEVMFTPEHGDRFLSRNIAVVITDGRSQETNKTRDMAAAAQRKGIKLFAIGVGKRVSQEELRNIASDPNWEHVFEVDNYKALDSIKDTLTSRTCYELTTAGPPNSPTPKPTTPLPVNTWDEERRTIIRTTRWNRTITETSWENEDEQKRLLEEQRRLKELEEQRLRDLEEKRVRELEDQKRRLKELEAELEKERQRIAALDLERKRLLDLEAEQERLRNLELEKQRQAEEELRRQRELQEEERRRWDLEAEKERLEAERLKRENEAELLRKQQEEQLRLQLEAERLRREQEAELLRRQQEAERLRRQQEADRLRLEQEAERRRKELEDERRRRWHFGNANRDGMDRYGVFGNGNTNQDKPDVTFVVPDPPNNLDFDKLLGRCNDKPADIYFVMDASSSIGRQNYKKQKRFLVNMARQFDIGADKTRVGVIPFSNNYKLAVSLGSANDIRSLSRAIHNVPYTRGGTHTAAALKYVKNYGFAPGIARPEAAQIVIVLTDGYSRDPASTRREAMKLHDAGINTFVIGIGNGIDMEELRSIASDPDDKHLFLVDDFNALDSIKDKLVSRACDTPVNSIVVCQTAGPLDLVFMYDTLNLGRERSTKISNFIFNIVDVFNQQSVSSVMVRRMVDFCPINTQTALMSPTDFLKLRGETFPGTYELLNQFIRGVQSNEYTRGKPIGITFLDSQLDRIDTILPFIHSLTDANLFTVIIGPEPQYNTSGMRNVMLVPNYDALESMVRHFMRTFCTTVTDLSFNSPPILF